MSKAPKMTEAEIDILIKRAGLTPDAELRAALHAGWPHVAIMTERVRTPRDRAAEPAHVFSLPIPDELKMDAGE